MIALSAQIVIPDQSIQEHISLGLWAKQLSVASKARNNHKIKTFDSYVKKNKVVKIRVLFLANVNSRSRSLYAIARPSVCRLSVCRLSVCL